MNSPPATNHAYALDFYTAPTISACHGDSVACGTRGAPSSYGTQAWLDKLSTALRPSLNAPGVGRQDVTRLYRQ